MIDSKTEEDRLKAEVEFYKKRFENSQKEKEILKQETLVLRKEMNSMKDFVKKIVVPKTNSKGKPEQQHSVDKNDMLAVLEFQRKRIDELETESQEIKKKYEKLLFDKKDNESFRPASVMLAEQGYSAEAALDKSNERVALLESRLREATSSYARETTNLKNKLVESQASDILASRNFSDRSDIMSRSISSSTLKKRDPLLEPIKADSTNGFTDSPPFKLNNRGSQTLIQDKSDEDSAGLFLYKKRTLSRQKQV